MKILVYALLLILAPYVSFIVTLYLYQGRLVYLPPALNEDELKPLAAYRSIEARTQDDILLKGYYREPVDGKPVFLVFHGNASHSVWKLSKFREWAKEGYGFLFAEYRGYAGNPGIPSEAGLYKDGEAYLRWINEQPGLRDNPVILYGESLGSGVAVDLASKNKISALILEVTFSSLADVGAYHYPYIPFARYIMNNKFPNEDKIGKVTAPVLFLLAGKDEVAPVQFGKELADLANDPKEVHIFENATHNNVYEHGAAKAVENFLKGHSLD